MFCSKCGKEVPENESVCPGCGNRVKTSLSSQKFDMSNAKGMLDSGISNAKSSWSSMGQTGILLAAIAGLLLICMFLWRGDILTITAEVWGYKHSEGLSGMELLNESGLMSFMITALYLVGIGAIAYPFVTKTAITKKLLLPAQAAVGFNLGALLGALIYGLIEGGDLLSYVTILPSFTGFVLLAAFVAIAVLCRKVSKAL